MGSVPMDRFSAPSRLTASLTDGGQPSSRPCEYAQRLLRAQAIFLSGLLFWLGVWDFTDIWAPSRLWLALAMVFGGATGLLCVVHQRYLCCRAGAEDDLTPEEAQLLSAAQPEAGRHSDGWLSRVASSASVLRAAPLMDAGHPFAAPPSARGLWLRRSLLGLVNVACGLTMYVGVWDILDYWLIPRVPACATNDVGAACASFKLGLAALGLLGLLVTGGLAAAADAGECGATIWSKRASSAPTVHAVALSAADAPWASDETRSFPGARGAEAELDRDPEACRDERGQGASRASSGVSRPGSARCTLRSE